MPARKLRGQCRSCGVEFFESRNNWMRYEIETDSEELIIHISTSYARCIDCLRRAIIFGKITVKGVQSV